MNTLRIALGRIVSLLNEYVFINRCPLCTHIVQKKSICADCMQKIPFIKDTFCYQCSNLVNIFNAKNEHGNYICSNCLVKKERIFFDATRSLFIYNNFTSSIIKDLKFKKKIANATILAELSVQLLGTFINAFDIIVPIPLHYFRLIKRNFNQSALIANKIGAIAAIPVDYNGVRRIKNTTYQTTLSIEERQKNMHRSFDIKKKNHFINKKILLVDDVFTTGATVNACAKEIRKAGALHIGVLTIGRTII